MGQTPSTKLEDRYHLQKVKLGQGSFGTVWRAVDKQDQSTVAIKQLDKASMPKRGVSREDIERECKVMIACKHANILGILDSFEDKKSVYIALEYCDGGDFGDKLKERSANLQEEEVVWWMRDICSAIAALHGTGICHRDVKPDNFMVKGAAGRQTLKMADFGLAVFKARGQLLTQKCGTPAFMAPEVVLLPGFSRGYSMPVDMWAAGCIMSMLMHGGQHPFMDSSGHLNERALLQGSTGFDVDVLLAPFLNGTSFSEDARQLCRRMLDPSPETRLSAQDALASPWMVKLRGLRRSPSPALMPNVPQSPSAAAALACRLVQALIDVGVDIGDDSPGKPLLARAGSKSPIGQHGRLSPKFSPTSGQGKPPVLPPSRSQSPLTKGPKAIQNNLHGSPKDAAGIPKHQGDRQTPTPCRAAVAAAAAAAAATRRQIYLS